MIWTKGLAKQLAGKGIRVIWVASGPVWTPLQVTGGQTQEKLVVFGENPPMGRPGQPAEGTVLCGACRSDAELFDRTDLRSGWGRRRPLI
jgi:NAD(P)-dependent dehydrogenase (short-subunit alcohol dehydrogenase family)